MNSKPPSATSVRMKTNFHPLLLVALFGVILHGTGLSPAWGQNPLVKKAESERKEILSPGNPEEGGTTADEREDEPEGEADSTPLGVDVAAIELISHQDEASMNAGFSGDPIKIAATIAAPEGVESALRPYLGKPISMAMLVRLSKEVVEAWRESDYPLVDVYFPEQNITGGRLQVVVREAVLGGKTVEGAVRTNSDYLLEQLRVRKGGRINRRIVEADLDWLNENPIRSVALVYERGEVDGASDILLVTQEMKPFTAYAGFSNTGVAITGEEEWAFGFNWANPFNTEQNIGYHYSTNLGFDSIQAHSVFYQNFLPWRHQLRLIGAHVSSDAGFEAAPGTFIDIAGESVQTSIEYRIPLGRPEWNRKLRHYATASWDYKSANTDLFFGGQNAFANDVAIFQFRFEYEAILPDQFGYTRGIFGLVLSPGDVIGNNDDAAFNLSRFGATADYSYFFADVEKVIQLPKDFSLELGGNLQITDDRLTSTEQILGGGYRSVRGFDENLIRGDSGFIGNIELVSPGFSIAQQVGVKADDQWNLVAFYDVAAFDVSSPFLGESSPSLQGLGLGLKCRINDSINGRLEYGWNVGEHGLAGQTAESGRVHFGLTVKY